MLKKGLQQQQQQEEFVSLALCFLPGETAWGTALNLEK